MEDTFETRVRTAAASAWWTVLAVAVLGTIQWVMYLVMMNARPTWLLRFFGPDATWPFVQTVWFLGTVILKLFVWGLATVAFWLTMWARQLKKRVQP